MTLFDFSAHTQSHKAVHEIAPVEIPFSRQHSIKACEGIGSVPPVTFLSCWPSSPPRFHPNNMGVSENSVLLNPMVLLIIIPMKNGYFIGKINPTFSDKPIFLKKIIIQISFATNSLKKTGSSDSWATLAMIH